MMNEIDTVLGFWLDEVGPAGWWFTDPALDEKIHARFGDHVARATAGALNPWRVTPRGSLALIILLDQFRRNMFRDTAAAYAADPLALRIAKSAIARGQDLAVPEPGRMFFYLPLEHSESLADQARCMRLMLLRVPGLNAQGLDASRKHREVIRRFGRFPSRNAPLGRQDTEAELAYRAEGGYMSGAPGSGPGVSESLG